MWPRKSLALVVACLAWTGMWNLRAEPRDAEWKALGRVKEDASLTIEYGLATSTLRRYGGLVVFDIRGRVFTKLPEETRQHDLFSRHVYNCRTKQFWPVVTLVFKFSELELEEQAAGGGDWGPLEGIAADAPAKPLLTQLSIACTKSGPTPRAEQYVLIAKGGKGALFVDLRDLTAKGPIRSYWEKMMTVVQEPLPDWLRNKQASDGKPGPTTRSVVVPSKAYSVSRRETDCRTMMTTDLSITRYGDATGDLHPVLIHDEIPPKERTSSRSSPGTLGDAVTAFICEI